ncbi:MAG: hypothetical protein JF619_11565 [Massilia sp.]|nr:hypothetical protein [Massilia sp.]
MKSLGPVTPEGKARVAKNASKPNSAGRQIAGMMAALMAVRRQVKVIEAERRRRQ